MTATEQQLLPARMLHEFAYCPGLFYYELAGGVFQTRAMRNIIAHDYGSVEMEIVWQTIQQNIAKVIDSFTERTEDASCAYSHAKTNLNL